MKYAVFKAFFPEEDKKEKKLILSPELKTFIIIEKIPTMMSLLRIEKIYYNLFGIVLYDSNQDWAKIIH